MADSDTLTIPDVVDDPLTALSNADPLVASSTDEPDSTTTTTTTTTTTSSEKEEDHVSLIVNGEEEGEQSAVPKALEYVPKTRLGRCWNNAEKNPRYLYCGLCWGVIGFALLAAVIITAIPGSGSRVEYLEYTARLDYSYVEGRSVDMVLAVAKDGRYVSKMLGVGSHSMESIEIHEGSTATVVEKVFDRYICDKLPLSSSGSLAIGNISPEWMLEDSDIECPEGSQVNSSSHCERWIRATFVGAGFYEGLIVLDKQTKLPLIYQQSVSGTKVVMKFKSFTVGPPDEAHFKVPEGVKCVDFTSKSGSKTLLSSFNGSSLINDPRAVAEVDAAAREMGWSAVANKNFDGMTRDSVTSMFRNPLSPFLMPNFGGYSQSSSSSAKRPVKRTFREIPEEYDARTAYPNCPTISDILNQASCGCCYAMAAATTFADRMCIATNGKFKQQLSTQWIIGCDDSSLGCNGGWVEGVWHYLHNNGTTTAACSSFLGVQSQCRSTCDNGSPVTIYRSEEPRDLHGDTPEETVRIIQEEILEHGPVEAAFYVFNDFMYGGFGVYRRSSSSTFEGGHAVRIIGWGSYAGKPYWLVANTWSKSWGSEGTFKIYRGTNECGFEDRVTAGVPILD